MSANEKIDVGDSVGVKVVKGGSGESYEPKPVEQPLPEQELVDCSVPLKIFKPIKEFLDQQIGKSGASETDVYSSLIHDAFRLHYHRMCPYCGESKLEWLKEAEFKRELAKKLKRLKEKRKKKSQKESRKRNRG